MPRNYGSIIAWSSADQLAALGLLHVVLALILVNGRAISERTSSFPSSPRPFLLTADAVWCPVV